MTWSTTTGGASAGDDPFRAPRETALVTLAISGVSGNIRGIRVLHVKKGAPQSSNRRRMARRV
jgi:hypothetical protein